MEATSRSLWPEAVTPFTAFYVRVSLQLNLTKHLCVEKEKKKRIIGFGNDIC